MHFAPLIVSTALLVLVAGAQAQEQERGFKERVLGEADRTLEFKGWDKSFNYGGGKIEAKNAGAKKFKFAQKVRARDFRTTDYLGTKGAWGGDFLYETEAVRSDGKYPVPKVNSEYTTAEVKVENLKGSEKTARTSTSRDADREYLGSEAEKIKSSERGNSAVSSGWQGKLRVLSIEDIRELLNKSE